MDHAFLYFLVTLLFGGHAVADYGLQSAYMAENKVQSPGNPDWFVTLGAHSLIHSFIVTVVVFGVMLLAGAASRDAAMLSTALGWSEAIVHFAIDRAKGQKRFSYRMDQSLHYGCKLLWAAIVYTYMA